MRRSVALEGSSAKTGTTSSCSCGKTSRNQPTQPASVSTAPSTLTDALVRSPAKSSANPTASTRGHAEEAGNSISRGPFELSLSWSANTEVVIPSPDSSSGNNVNHGEDNDPDCIHKMPVQRKHIQTSGMLPADTPRQAEKEHDTEHEQTGGDVKRVQTNKRVIRGPKKTGRNGQPVFVDEAVPFPTGAVEEERAEKNGKRQQT